ncbi:GTP-binding protein [Candidatus Parcubacteria bacterium]|nr:MAG: GTP-binding protein [Candidatus Parcubacteria bacterium]
MNLRNIAIIAHVDHGKTTLVDALLKQSLNFKLKSGAASDLIMDSNELERERGITIFSKNAAVIYGDTKINIIDTPGHADFGGEVERVLNMADGSLLLVDAQEGPMPQTRFVLKKALDAGHKIIVIVNKIDKPNARINHTLERVIELFIELGATNDQLNFPILYAAGKLGVAGRSPALGTMKDVTPLFDAIVDHIPAPRAVGDAPFQMMVISIHYDNYQGRVAVGRIHRGAASDGMQIARIRPGGVAKNYKITGLTTFSGLGRVPAASVGAGDIAALAGIPEVNIGDTLADAASPDPLPPVMIEKPTVKMVFSVNNSPFSGAEGEYCTSRNLRDRLFRELDNDVALRVEEGASAEEFVVSGRGELHLAILIEKMRREGYELQVSRPEVIFMVGQTHRSSDGMTPAAASGDLVPYRPEQDRRGEGKVLEPAEDVWIDVPEQYSGLVIQKMNLRKGELKNMSVDNGTASFHFFIPTRGLIGFRNEFMIETRGTGVINSLFAGYFPKFDSVPASPHGSLVAHESGVTTAYALLRAQERGVMFLGPGEKVYEGQVVGQNAKTEDIAVNVCKQKQLTNFRAKTDAVTDDLVPPCMLSLEQALEYIGEDELVEVTPKSIRLRKRVLRNAAR